MVAALLIMIREGFEAALVVAILLAYLRRTGRTPARRQVWLGVAAAVAVAIAVGVAVHLTIGELTGPARLRAFAVVALTAGATLTWMIFWMRAHSRGLKGDLEARLERSLATNPLRAGLAATAFVAVLREGVEATLLLVAAASDADGWNVIAGATIGIAIAVALACAVYVGGRSLPMASFFKVTGLVLIVFAAGLVSRSVLFLQSDGDLGSFNLNGVYDLRSVAWLTQTSEVGKFLAAMVGWDPRPSIEQVAVWLGYVVPVTYLFLRTGSRDRSGASGVPAVARSASVSRDPVP